MPVKTKKDVSIDPPQPRPPIKWAGGKSQLIPQLTPLFPAKFNTLIEPFAGGAAVFFHLRPTWAILIDSNEELVNFYRVVRDNLAQLLVDLKKHVIAKDYYYRIRAVDPGNLSDVERASRFLYLNKTCFNGLYRLNSKGQFNVPFGRYKNPRLVDESNLRLVSDALRMTLLHCDDFTVASELAVTGTFIYLDPPYHPASATSSFTSYTGRSFSESDQRRLANLYRELDRKGCLLMLSNSNTPLIRELYRGYDIKTVTARRSINCKGGKRGAVKELVIRNYTTTGYL